MGNKIKCSFKRIVGCILALIDIVPSLVVIFNPLLFIMFIPVGVYAILTWPWTILRNIPDPFHPGESLYWLTYVIMLNRDNVFFPTLFRWGLVDSLLVAAGSAIFLVSFISWLINLKRGGDLITNGIYRISRHPQYLGIILLSLGITVRSLRPVSLIAWATLLTGYLILASLEERSLLRIHGIKYEEYAKRTAFLLPYLKLKLPKSLSAEKPNRYLFFMLIWFALIITIIVYTRSIAVALRVSSILDNTFPLS